ncbi:MAG: hypothetical protein HY313_00375 [Acidobacteria bacterium]|nr:hypothetical protein [Acidobacteriota bacterium]
MAWVYRKYAAPQSVLYRLEQDARTARRGLWADTHPTPPWDWRKPPVKKGVTPRRRTKASTEARVSTCWPKDCPTPWNSRTHLESFGRTWDHSV